jgi:hypothetical protein
MVRSSGPDGAFDVILWRHARDAPHNAKIGSSPPQIKSLFWINAIIATDEQSYVGA